MIKSKLTNDIFREEMLHLYEQKTVARDELVQEARQAMLELVQKMRDGLCSQPKAEQLIWELSMKLETVQGKKSYGYLPKSVKKLVDSVVDEMERMPIVRECRSIRSSAARCRASASPWVTRRMTIPTMARP